MKKIYLLIIFIILVSVNAISCKNIKQEQLVMESQNQDSTINNYNEEEVANIIFIIPEVVALNNSIRNATNGERGASILYDDVDNELKKFLQLKVGDNSEIRFQTYYRFLVDKKTNDIYVIWGDEELYPLEGWGKINGIQKEYKNYSDSVKYVDYLSKHYLNVPKEIDGYYLAKANEEENNFYSIYSKIKILNTALPFKSAPNIPLDERTSKWDNLFSQNEEFTSFTCGDKTFNYYPLVQINDIKVVLSPVQCGDFYQVFLLVFNKEGLKSSLYVDGLYSDPEEINEISPILENTSFSMDNNNKIIIYKRIDDKITVNSFQIEDDGKIIKIE